MVKAFPSAWSIVAVGLLVALTPAGYAQTTASGATMLPPPTTLQQRLVEHREYQARIAAQRSRTQKSRLRRLTGSGQAAGAPAVTAPGAAAGEVGTMIARRTVQAAMGALVTAVAVAAASGDVGAIADVSDGAGSSAAAASVSASSVSTTTSTGTN